MPLIRCPECSQAYDVPPAVAVKLPNSIANCHCGHWLCGSREALLHRLGEIGRIEEIDMQPFLTTAAATDTSPGHIAVTAAVNRPRSIHVTARAKDESVNTTFTITEHPLWIGRKGCHIDFDDAELSIQHCCIFVSGDQLMLRDADSYTGTFLDGRQIHESSIDDGMHLLRVGSALLAIEPVEAAGVTVEALSIAEEALHAPPSALRSRKAATEAPRELVLRCLDGMQKDERFSIPPTGATVGREGVIRINDEYLSRRHFLLSWDEAGALRVQDLGSRNGTFLNTLPAKNTRVHAGDEIRAGMSMFRIEEK